MDHKDQDDRTDSADFKSKESRIRTIGVVGAGTMGSGIAQIAAQAGLEVVLIDQSESWLDRGLATITGNLDRLVAKERMSDERRDAILMRIEGSISIDHVSPCDLVIEAVNESLPTKTEVFASVSDIVDPDVILVSNTSSISITALAGSVPNPERVAGMHFFNPVPVMKLVEVIRGLQTSDATISTVTGLAEQIGKTPVQVQPDPAADDQRGGILSVRRSGVGIRYRYRDEARSIASDGAARAGGSDRSGCVPEHSGSASP
jgi:3-hydroxybutyryl-CoA dehydrogenase